MFPSQADYIPRRYHEQQIEALTIRSLTAENNLIMLLDFIDPAIVERHHNDWLAAVQELMPPTPAPEIVKRKKGTK